MRERRSQLALVEQDGRQLGLVTLTDLVDRLLRAGVPAPDGRAPDTPGRAAEGG